MKLMARSSDPSNVLARQGIFGLGAVFVGLALMLARGITGWALLVSAASLIAMGVIAGRESKRAGWIIGVAGVLMGMPFVFQSFLPIIHGILDIGCWGVLGLGGLALAGFIFNLLRRM